MRFQACVSVCPLPERPASSSAMCVLRACRFGWTSTQVRSLTNFRSSARQRVLAIEIQRAPLSAAQRFVKRITDIFVGALALVFFLPLMVLTAIAIKLDGPGPFRQSRKGSTARNLSYSNFEL